MSPLSRALLFAGIALAACDPVPDLDLERMKDQTSLRPYEPTTYFPNGLAMQTPVAGTVAREAPLGDETASPPLTRALLQRGRSRYEIYCGACHGLRGDGVTPIRQNFELRAPPTLLDEKVRARPPEEIYRIVSGGWGLMPAYGEELTVPDRWAVVAYLRALQRSQTARLSDLPAELRTEADAALKDQQRGKGQP